MRKIEEALKQKMIVPKVLYYFLIKLNLSNNYLATLSFRNITMNKLRKKYSNYLNNLKLEEKKRDFSKTIWFCWLQGIDQAPDLVKKSYKSIKMHNLDFNIIVIDKENFMEYVRIPEIILKKWKSGIISNTHFSDLLRLELLIRYGGIWVDATTFFTDKIPSDLYNLDLFFFAERNWGDITMNMGNWFIISKSNSKLLIATRELLYEYWRRNNTLQEYFIFHLFFKMATEKYEEEYRKVPFYLQDNCHILSHEIFDKYDETRFNQIKKISFVHKLSNKMEIPEDYNNTYYSKLMNGEL